MYKLLTTLLLTWVLSPTASAQDSWRFSGFASLAAGRLDHSGLTYSNYDNEKWRFDGDTVLGLQLSGNLAERLTLTMQAVSRAHSFDDQEPFEPQLDWLFLAYQLNANWRLRAGRLRTPHYLYSETLDVGYSYVWARPPIDVYANVLAPFSNFDGADITYLMDYNETSIDLQFLAGTMRRSLDAIKIEVKPVVGGNIKIQNGPYTLRYSLLYDQSDIRLNGPRPSDPAFRQLAASNAQLGFILDSLESEDAWYRYQSLGLRWEQDEYAVLGEVFDIKNTDEGYSNDAHGWYISAQKRFGDLTPYLVRGGFTNELNKEAFQVLKSTYATIPPGIPGLQVLDRVRDRVGRYLQLSNYRQNTWTFGVRWDFYSDLALKAEWQRLDFSDGTSGQILPTNEAPPSHTVLTTISLDWVF
ncbi:hypothetical protein [Ketobacter sp.]